jgi:8-oxo-dGTP diphosphatase
MDHRIKVRVLLLHEGKLLLVAHRHQASGAVWWSPPSGTIERDESILACAVREVWEETGLTIVPVNPSPQTHYLGLHLRN